MHIQFLKLTLLQKIIKKIIQGYRWDFSFWDYFFIIIICLAFPREDSDLSRIFPIWDLDSRENVVLCSWKNGPLKLLHFCFFFLVSFPFYYFLSLTRRFIYIFSQKTILHFQSFSGSFFFAFTCCIINGFNTFFCKVFFIHFCLTSSMCTEQNLP